MPWTFAHPAAVFPIKQSRLGKYLNLSALVIGSISPDLFYSFGLYGLATKAHHFLGWLYTGLPLSILFYLVVLYLSNSLAKILPLPITFTQQWNYTQVIVLILSLFVGAATHIIWDDFTHETGQFVRNITFLQDSLFSSMTDGQEIRIYKILQYLSSLLGVIYLLLKYKQYQCDLNKKEQQINQRKLYKLFIMAIMSAVIVLPLSFYLSNWMVNFNKFIFYELSFSVSVFFIMIIIYALWLRKS